MEKSSIELQARLSAASKKSLNKDIAALQPKLNRIKLRPGLDPKATAGIKKQLKEIVNGQKVEIPGGQATAAPAQSAQGASSEKKDAKTNQKGFLKEIRSAMDAFNIKLDSASLFSKAIDFSKSGIASVRQLDSALSGLEETTSMSAGELNNFYYRANDIAKQMGVSTAEIINQASAWARLGYSTSGAASMMAKLSSQFAAISPGMGGSDAAASLASVMDAYGIDAGHVLDGVMSKINMVGKHFGTSNAEIAEGLRQSSSAMASAGGTIDDNIALFAGGQEIIQNASQVGDAIRSICMRIQGYDEQTGQFSENLTGISSAVADLTKTASYDGRGISLFTDESQTEYKNLVTYLGEIAAIWDRLDSTAQTSLTDALFGKNGSQAGAAMIENFDQVRRSIEYMGSSAGSADAELSAVMDGLDYKLNRLSESGTGIAQNLFHGKDMNTLVDILNSFTDVLDAATGKLGLFKTAALGIGGILGAKNLGQQKTDRRGLCGAQYIPRAGVGIPGQNTKNYAM